MRLARYILINKSHSEDAVFAIHNISVSDFRHGHIVSAAGLTHPELISVLVRKQWSSAKNLGISGLGIGIRDQRLVSCCRICPSDSMNQLRREFDVSNSQTIQCLERNFILRCGSVFVFLLVHHVLLANISSIIFFKYSLASVNSFV